MMQCHAPQEKPSSDVGHAATAAKALLCSIYDAQAVRRAYPNLSFEPRKQLQVNLIKMTRIFRYHPATILAGAPFLEAAFFEAAAAESLSQPSERGGPTVTAAAAHAHVGAAEVEALLIVERERRSLSDLDRLVALLPAFPEFARVAPRELRQLARLAVLRPFRARETLLAPDSPSCSWLGVLRGSVSIHVGGLGPGQGAGSAAADGGGGRGVGLGAAGQQAQAINSGLSGGTREALGIRLCTRVAGPGEMLGGLALLLEGSQATIAVGRSDGACLALDGKELPTLLLAHVRASLPRPMFRASIHVNGAGFGRSEYEVMCLAEYMRENPFFQQAGIDDKAIQASLVGT